SCGCEKGYGMTITGTEAYEAMLTHHRLLNEQLSSRAAAVSEAVAAGRRPDAAVAEMIAYLAEEVLPHAIAEEETIYPAVAAARPDLTATVSEMVAEHRTLSASAGALAALADGQAAAEKARHIADLFDAHAARENDVLLPALLASDDVDLAALLAQMHRHAEEAAKTDRTGEAATRDPQRALLDLLLEAARALGRAGQADLACRLAAAAWAVLREGRADLAVTVTAVLHGLARRVGAEPAHDERTVPVGRPSRVPAGTRSGPDLDVRDMPPARRHEAIFATYEDLAPGAAFVLVNDHDPKPLRYQFEAEHTGQFTWEALVPGPEVWRVRIGRAPAATLAGDVQAEPGGGQAGPDGRGEEPDLDVRQLAHGQRHDVIFSTYHALQPAAGFVLINDHNPLPLRYQFEAQHPGEFTWDYLEAGPRTWRVRIGRPGA
ncbi:MAG TPA: DUF2249 domain-containing protein, partial [Streptosporangiaceae bacterium]|nr:DUF2249 domain-containing protein [Streptosporangiaceae bacterium]